MSFNLVHEQWIPCLTRDNEYVELSLLDVLTAPDQVREIVDSSPLVTIALHRLLLAILHRALVGPRDEDEWSRWWQQGCWPIDPVHDYLCRWQHRFDLFDHNRPFYQHPGVDRRYEAESARLATEFASSFNAPLLFDHHDPDQVALTPAQAARYLIAYQSFAPGGLLSGRTPADRSSKAAPLCNVAVCLGKGESLARTLLLNLVPPAFRGSYEPPGVNCTDDQPAWERDTLPSDQPRWPCGYLDYLTWQARRVLLLPEVRGGTVVVPRSVIMRGESFPEGFEQRQLETMVPFRRDPKRGWLPIGFQQDRALWRDSLALTQTVAHGEPDLQSPQLVRWWAHLFRNGLLPRAVVPLDVGGLVPDQAKPEFWRYERFPLPLQLLDDLEALEWLAQFLQLAEAAAHALLRVLRGLALGFGVVNKQVTSFVSSLGAERAFWSALEPTFYPLFHRLAQPGADCVALCAEWLKHVRLASWAAFRVAADALQRAGRAEFELATAETKLAAELRKLTCGGGAISDSHQQDEEVPV